MQSQSQVTEKPMYHRTPTTMGGRPGNCWHCGGQGHWRSDCEVLKKSQVNNKISSFHFSDSLVNTQVPSCFDYDIKVTHESTAGTIASSPAKVLSYLPFDKPFTSRPSKFIISAD